MSLVGIIVEYAIQRNYRFFYLEQRIEQRQIVVAVVAEDKKIHFTRENAPQEREPCCRMVVYFFLNVKQYWLLRSFA